MERQRVRLTDQALVAVSTARAGARGRGATVADLLLGLAIEPEGAAGRRLRAQSNGLAGLQARVAGRLPTLAPLDVALAWGARDAEPRPAGTLDLLDAALEAGGNELADLLDACGLHLVPTGAPAPSLSVEAAAEVLETFGYDPANRLLSPPAARAVARARAVAGGPLALLAVLAADDDDLRLDPDALLRGADVADLCAGDLEAVVDAAVAGRLHERAVEPADLLRAALMVGGPAVRAVVRQASA